MCVDSRTYVLDQIHNIMGSSMCIVYDKPRVFFTDARAADTKAFQAALLDQSAGKVSLRTLENTARRR